MVWCGGSGSARWWWWWEWWWELRCGGCQTSLPASQMRRVPTRDREAHRWVDWGGGGNGMDGATGSGRTARHPPVEHPRRPSKSR